MQAARLIERLFALAGLLGEARDRELAGRGLTTARAEMIWRLHQQGPMTQRHLSEALRCTPRNVTGLVDALEASGHAVRRPHPTDRRATLVTLTSRGETTAEQWRAGSHHLATTLFGDLTPADLDKLDELLNRIVGRLASSEAAATDPH